MPWFAILFTLGFLAFVWASAHLVNTVARIERKRTRESIQDALLTDRSRAELAHGAGAWDVADVLRVLEDKKVI